MRAIILAGGRGTRLAPYTTAFPKPLMPIGEYPIIDIIVRQLANYGFQNVTLTTGYLAELIQAYFTTSGAAPNVNLSYVRETSRTGTAGSLSLVEDLNDTFLVMNGDVLTSMDYRELVSYHREQGGVLTIAIHKKRVKIDLGVIEMNSDRSLVNYIEKPEKEYNVSMGVYVYEPSVLKYISKGEYLDFPDLVLRLLENGERVVGYPSDEYWMDIGNHDDYAKAQEEFDSVKHKILPSLDD